MTSAHEDPALRALASDPYAARPADPDRPSGTYTMDWINMLPLPDASIRVYHAVRMFIFDKAGDYTVSLTNEEIGELTPQANGKPRHARSVARAMEPLFEMGLFELVEMVKISVRVPDNPKPEVRTVRTIAVRDEPKGGFAAYCGPKNPFVARKRLAEKRARERAARREAATRAVRGESGRTDLSRQSDQGSLFDGEPAGDVSAGQSDVTDLSPRGDRSVGGPDEFVAEAGQIRPVKEATRGTNTGEPSTDNPGGPTPLAPPDPAAEAAGLNTADHSAQVVTTQGELDSDHLLARAREVNEALERAREWAGPAAAKAIEADPDISVEALEKVIAEAHDGRLTQAQVVSRAWRLFAEESRARRESAPRQPRNAGAA